MARLPKTAGSEQDDDSFLLSDADLGIGEAAAPAEDTPDRVAEMMANPAIAAVVESLVQKRLAELAAAPSAAAAASPGVDIVAAMKAFAQEMASAINRSTAATVEQMPGHVKPIPVEEVEARAAAYTEMQALLRDTTTRYMRLSEAGQTAEAERIVPMYLLQEDFFGPGDAGSEMYLAGETIRWFGAPGTYMEPKNDIAMRLSDQAWRYLGGHGAPSVEDIGAFASQMNRPRMPGADVPELPQLIGPMRGSLGASRVTEAGTVSVGPDRVMGTLIEELKGGFGRPAYVVER